MHHLRIETFDKKGRRISLKNSKMEHIEHREGSKKDEETPKKDRKSDSMQFFSGNPAVEEIEGVIHLYKNETKPGEKELTIGSIPVNKGQLLCVLAVPSYMSPSDFAAFTGAYHKNIKNMRIIRDSNPTKYMVLIKFTDQDSTDEFYLQFNGKAFNSMETETCCVFYVSSVEFVKSQPSERVFPPSGQVELPTCPVCLEKLDDSISGVLTILCNHSFHCQCLSKWKGDNCCPVCRHCQQPEGQSPVCSTCYTTESLWICLVCGNVGCGRYVNEHARLHYKETMHAYALELQTARVWDYAGDGYVHRLVQNKSDGKLVEVMPPPAIAEAEAENGQDMSKLESVSLEYTYLLESQKKYFDEQLRKIERDKLRKVTHLEEEYAQLLEGKVQTERKLRDFDEEKKRHQKKQQALEKHIKDLQQENGFLQEINNALKANQSEWQQKIKEAEQKVADDSRDKKIQELEEQIRDLMFFIEAKQKIESNADNDIKDGKIVVTLPPASNNTSTKRTPNSNRKKREKG
eukprot:TRINITY_DN7222_c0_g1_i1.p1 TRINITY_DN7222_c0_g1~~TRINITY_DN7222_c0_g1_i1.p1  ORF type:complete len:518 (+),score=119.39 TRINITY_DN7222_c0_g1_i1:63-1616(+)